MEQAKGHSGNNILTVLMKAKDIDLQDASDLVGDHFAESMRRFEEGKRDLVEQRDVQLFGEIQDALRWRRSERRWGSRRGAYLHRSTVADGRVARWARWVQEVESAG